MKEIRSYQEREKSLKDVHLHVRDFRRLLAGVCDVVDTWPLGGLLVLVKFWPYFADGHAKVQSESA